MNELPVMEHFLTLQGEGFHTGKSAVFIRLAGCDVGCVWCDVKESWDKEKHPVLSVSEIVEKTLDLLKNHESYDKMSKLHNPYGDGLASKRIVKFLKSLN